MSENQTTLRDRLEDILEYANIDEEVIVSAINNDLLPLKAAVEDMLKR